MLYTLNLYNVIWQVYLNKTRGENKRFKDTKFGKLYMKNKNAKYLNEFYLDHMF